ncbi:hypothetical protein BDV96DRAFT_650874 [Lophiotrema nucula]|uniref:F-box domain-containing protein n=1 Tax=Lophiotrema nucula TaxID=690887 RepID=A0A6A5YUI4_9PLEO|nr:hypothetical protein BDV96DRAFT_650874 [Lophiotrema nucula]
MEELANELHYHIAGYLPSSGLCSYRLVSKRFEEIGASTLFRTLTFHASSNSASRLEAMSQHQQLRHAVKVLVWDTNLWDLHLAPDNIEQFARDHYTRTARPEYTDSWPPGIQSMFHGYQRARKDEEAVLSKGGILSAMNMVSLLHRFPNLHEMVLINGEFSCQNEAVTRTDNKVRGHYHCLHAGKPFVRGRALHYSTREDGRPAIHAWHRLLGVNGLKRAKLRVETLSWFAFARSQMPTLGWCDTLTVLELKINMWSYFEENYPDERTAFKSHQLADILRGLRNLETLSLGSEDSRTFSGMLSPESRTDLGLVLPYDFIWPKMRSLTLENVDTAEEDLLLFLGNHARTLRCLRLSNLRLIPDGDWIVLSYECEIA